jgi:phosphatidylglycerophosphatase A
MTEKTDPPEPGAAPSSPSIESAGNESLDKRNAADRRKPRLAIFVATAAGLGYFPKAPGTFGSLAGLAVASAPLWVSLALSAIYMGATGGGASIFVESREVGIFDPVFDVQILITILIAGVGVWSAARASKFWNIKDPQRVVIDEVSGQHLTLLLGCGVPLWWKNQNIPFQFTSMPIGLISTRSALNWKYLLLGFILFRLFDIWKPFPARQAESLPGGWGIMADDWVAGVYAAIGLWLARAAGL